VKKTLLLFFYSALLLSYFFINNDSHAQSGSSTTSNITTNNKVSSYIMSESFSNILPIKQLVDDNWLQAPATDSSIAFTQNEIGLRTTWHNFSFNIAHRFDYFVFTNSDTAQAYYLEQADQPLTTQDSYKLSLKLHHQRSSGFRLGYQWLFDNFSAEVNVGYWDVSATRESQIHGEIYGEDNNNITGIADLKEFYTDKNFLKHSNNNNWETNGYGVTLDLTFSWLINEKISLNADIKDLYSEFKMKGLGFNQGTVDTDGTFINSLGGKSYLPLYQGIFGPTDYNFNLPERVNLLARYQGGYYSNDYISMSYIARYKRQGEVNFYYIGMELAFEQSTLKLMLDLDHLSPEVQYGNKWLNVIFAIDELDIDKAMQFTLGVAVNYSF